jgi:cobalamin biosynthesis Mg chelatase CobN
MVRKLLLLLLLGLPLTAQADSGVVTAPAQTNSGLQQTGNTTASPQMLNLLQPANTGSASASLQPAGASNEGDVAQSTTQDLQQTGASNQASLMVQGEGDSPHSLSSSPDLTWLGYAVVVLLVATAITAVIWWFQRRRI